MAQPDTTSGYPALSWLERGVILAIALAIFLFINGPIWRHAMRWDSPIAWSYGAIPVLVALALARRRRLAWVPGLLHTCELLFVKFAITGSILGLMLATAKPAELEAAPLPEPQLVHPPAAPPVVVTKVPPPSETGSVSGRVLDAQGRPVSGAVVFVSSGLERYAFPVTTDVFVLRDDGSGFSPSLAIVQVGRTVQLRSGDHRLHTFRAERLDDRWVLNVPVNPAGRTLSFDAPKGVMQVRCTVHPTEPASYLLVLDHPFSVRSDSAGRFALERVPQGDLELAAFAPGEALARRAIAVGAQPGADAVLQFSAAADDAGR